MHAHLADATHVRPTLRTSAVDENLWRRRGDGTHEAICAAIPTPVAADYQREKGVR